MVQKLKNHTVEAERLLYDEARLGTLIDEYGTAMNVKLNVATTATTYEIYTAVRYWFGGKKPQVTSYNRQISQTVWNRCKGVENGMYDMEDGELVDA